MKIKFYYDEDGYPRVQVPPEYEVLDLYLGHDVQNSPYVTQHLIDRVDEIALGKQLRDKIIGNAFRLILTPETAQIESLFDEPPLTLELPLADFRNILMDWLDMVNKWNA